MGQRGGPVASIHSIHCDRSPKTSDSRHGRLCYIGWGAHKFRRGTVLTASWNSRYSSSVLQFLATDFSYGLWKWTRPNPTFFFACKHIADKLQPPKRLYIIAHSKGCCAELDVHEMFMLNILRSSCCCVGQCAETFESTRLELQRNNLFGSEGKDALGVLASLYSENPLQSA